MALYRSDRLKQLANSIPSGVPVTSKELSQKGISPQLAHHYVRAGWLNRLARGVFVRPGDEVHILPALRTLERLGYHFHIGARSALDLLGVRHNVRFEGTTVLYTTRAFVLPVWLTQRHKVEVRQRRLFKDSAQRMGLSRLEDDEKNPWISDRERAVLELLSEVPQHQSLEEARQVVEVLHTLRSALMAQLLEACRSVKAVRLFLMLAKEANLPVLSKINKRKLPTGSRARWVGKTKSGLLVLKP